MSLSQEGHIANNPGLTLVIINNLKGEIERLKEENAKLTLIHPDSVVITNERYEKLIEYENSTKLDHAIRYGGTD